MFAGFGRLIGPTIGTHLYTDYGTSAAWILEIAVILAVLSTWLVFYRRMVPLKMGADGPCNSSVSSISILDSHSLTKIKL